MNGGSKIHRIMAAVGGAFLVNSGGDYRVACVGAAQKHSAAIFISREAETVAGTLWVGSDLVEAKNAHQNHSDQWSCEEKCLPAGLKGDSLHADPLV